MSNTLGWDVREALVKIDQLLVIFEPVSSEADEVVCQAKTMWESDQQSDALELLIDFVNNHSSKVSEAIPKLRELKDILESMGGQVDAQESKILQLESHIKQQDQQIKKQDRRIGVLEENANRAAAAKNRKRQQVLLGQAAYTLAKIIEQYVYGPAGIPHSLGLPTTLNKIMKTDKQEEQRARWEEVKQYCSSIMPFEDLLTIDKALREQRFSVAHGSKAEKEQTTFRELTTWAGVHLPASAVTAAQNYVRVLNNFSSKNKPLVPDVKSVRVFH